jgi:hypothetical protein
MGSVYSTRSSTGSITVIRNTSKLVRKIFRRLSSAVPGRYPGLRRAFLRVAILVAQWHKNASAGITSFGEIRSFREARVMRIGGVGQFGQLSPDDPCAPDLFREMVKVVVNREFVDVELS